MCRRSGRGTLDRAQEIDGPDDCCEPERPGNAVQAIVIDIRPEAPELNQLPPRVCEQAGRALAPLVGQLLVSTGDAPD